MKLEDQVCTLEQAKRLKELGVLQGHSYAAFIKNKCQQETKFWLMPVNSPGVSNEGYEKWDSGCLNGFSAFTSAELGQMLPFGYDTMQCTGEGWRGYDLDHGDYGPFETEAKARAAMLIQLLETNAITADEVNKRLTHETP